MFRPIDEEKQYCPASDGDSVLVNPELAADIQDILTRINACGQEMKRVEMIMEDNGLGTIPRTLHSVSSIMLFNSNINVFANYQALDNLETAGR